MGNPWHFSLELLVPYPQLCGPIRARQALRAAWMKRLDFIGEKCRILHALQRCQIQQQDQWQTIREDHVSISLRPLNWLEQAPTDRPARNLIVDMWEGGSQTGLVRSCLSLVVWKAEVIAKAVSP